MNLGNAALRLAPLRAALLSLSIGQSTTWCRNGWLLVALVAHSRTHLTKYQVRHGLRPLRDETCFIASETARAAFSRPKPYSLL